MLGNLPAQQVGSGRGKPHSRQSQAKSTTGAPSYGQLYGKQPVGQSHQIISPSKAMRAENQYSEP